MKANRPVLFIFLLALIVAASGLHAEVVILKNGRQISGRIVGQSRSVVRIATAGGTRTIAKGKVRRIVYGATLEKKKEDEDRRKKQKELLKKQQEEFRKRQEELIKKQQEENIKTQAENQKRLLEQQRQQLEAARRAEAASPAQNSQQEDSAPTLGGALWRSALLPGWGQIYQGRSGIGIGYAAGFAALVGTTGAAYQDFWIQRNAYRRASDTFLYTSTLFLDQTGQSLPSSGSITDNLLMASIARASGTQFGVERYIARGDLDAAGLFFYEFRNTKLSVNDREKLFMLDALATSARHRTNMKRAAYNLNAAATVLGSFYVWNLVDAAAFAPGGGFLSFTVLPGQFGFVYGTRF